MAVIVVLFMASTFLRWFARHAGNAAALLHVVPISLAAPAPRSCLSGAGWPRRHARHARSATTCQDPASACDMGASPRSRCITRSKQAG